MTTTQTRPSVDRAAMQDVLDQLTYRQLRSMLAYLEPCEPAYFRDALDYVSQQGAARCPYCPREVQAPTREMALRLLAAVHVCDLAPVDEDNDPRRPRDDAHAAQMEAARLLPATDR